MVLSRIKNSIDAVKRGRPFDFSFFLTYEQQKVVCDYISANGMQFTCYGGYSDSERVIASVFFDEQPETYQFPIIPIAFKIPNKAVLEHRDVLGSLMSLGVKRELFGDIIFYNDFCIFFVECRMIDYILNNFTAVKNYKVEPFVFEEVIEYKRAFEEVFSITSSMRLDCVLSELVSISRTRSSELIESGFVFVNGTECVKKDKLLNVNDILSVRKKGKFKISEVVGKTKKDRIKLKILKYI